MSFPTTRKPGWSGDGYFNNPNEGEPYYVGPEWHGFYKNTDVGYLRFIYYFGITGLSAFALFIGKAGRICMKRFVSYRSLFAMIVLLNFAVWFKVSTDLFLVFALFLCMDGEEDRVYEQRRLAEESRQS